MKNPVQTLSYQVLFPELSCEVTDEVLELERGVDGVDGVGGVGGSDVGMFSHVDKPSLCAHLQGPCTAIVCRERGIRLRKWGCSKGDCGRGCKTLNLLTSFT